jgi:prepilin-type processing-associated H-X9-DG protein
MVPAQFGKVMDYLTGDVTSLMPYANDDAQGTYPRADSDVTGAAPYGNGGGDTVYRLREGIERFMITDINNAAAGAKAQSSIFVLFDQLATNPANFNHIPGGSNVLYMDGHVEFHKYEMNGVMPTNGAMAVMIGVITSL